MDAFVGDVFYSSPVVDQNGTTYVIGYTGGGENHSLMIRMEPKYGTPMPALFKIGVL